VHLPRTLHDPTTLITVALRFADSIIADDLAYHTSDDSWCTYACSVVRPDSLCRWVICVRHACTAQHGMFGGGHFTSNNGWCMNACSAALLYIIHRRGNLLWHACTAQQCQRFRADCTSDDNWRIHACSAAHRQKLRLDILLFDILGRRHSCYDMLALHSNAKGLELTILAMTAAACVHAAQHNHRNWT
jgi:hypothetical protein